MNRHLSLASPDFSRASNRSRSLLPLPSTTFQEDAPDDIGSCENLLQTLIDEGVAGPLLFRLHSEFDVLEEAGQSDVLKAKDETVEKIQKTRKTTNLTWPIDSIVIKRHRPRTDFSTQLGHHFLAARREVLALSHRSFEGHPNIVQLKAWGFCLDTIEKPQQQSLQVPLLILERAEADLEQFLKWEGRALTKHSHRLRIRLCRDIGTGLEVLHQSGFTHGDLKPKNILVFRGLHGRTAKLCDFGCAQSQASESPVKTIQGEEDQIPRYGATTYLGTANWLPPEVATRSRKIFNHEALQRCDIFVYGMVVWSTLCKDGKSCTSNDLVDPLRAQHQAIQDLKALGMNSNSLSMASKTVQDCLCHPNERSLTPWDNLHLRTISSAVSNQVRQMATALLNPDLYPVAQAIKRTSTTFDFVRGKKTQISSPRKPNACRPLDPDEKAQYESQPWWTKQQTSIYGTMLLSPSPPILTRPEDGDSRSLTTFHHLRGETEIRAVHKDIVSSLGQFTTPHAIRLYCCARFRSRVSLHEWKALGLKGNLVELALTSRPLPEISSLAWLCRGEVGVHEVKTLPPTFKTWDAILKPNLLNESERLERFLLLLQSGAEIQQELPPSPTWIDHEKRSILFEYIRSCRRAVVGMVMKEIISHLDSVQNEPQISEGTKYYLTGHGKLFSSTALGHFVEAINYEAVLELHRVFGKRSLESIEESDLSAPINVNKNATKYRLEFRRDAQQIVNLLHTQTGKGQRQVELASSSKQNQIPRDIELGNRRSMAQEQGHVVPGWEVIKIDSNNEEFLIYRDLITQSITMHKPCVNFLTGSQVQIGYHDRRGESFYLTDISFFFRSNFNFEAFKKRFPIYSEEWFSGEQSVKAPTEDILGTLTDRWRMPSLTETVDITWLTYFLSMWQKVFSTSWVTLVLYGLRLLPLVTIMLHKAKEQ